ncbi:hypothetical protein LCGC14_1756130 [marine sediment metagenome]|uniref:Agmatine deiminase n=1 Tax=marine sediment metagenome TaxID=412755 RepID=A0A0F9H2H0_9ZZZZ
MDRSKADNAVALGKVGPSRHVRRPGVMLCLGLLAAAGFASSLALAPRLLRSEGAESAGRPDWDRLAECRFVPEYDRRLNKVLISVRANGASLALHHELLMRLPEYTQVILLMPAGYLSAIEAELKGKPYADRIRIAAYDPDVQPNLLFYYVFPDKDRLVEVSVGPRPAARRLDSVWAQDLLEVTTGPNGRPVLLVPPVHKYFSGVAANRDDRLESDNACLQVLSAEQLELQRVPVAFRGGNVLVDRINGRRVVFIGSDTFRTARAASQAFGRQELTESEIIACLKRALNADLVVVMGRSGPQPEHIFHLDQAMMLLHGGVAVVARIVGGAPDAPEQATKLADARDFLSEARSRLRELGYRVVDLATSAQDVLQFRHRINAIPYVDAETGQRTVLMPVFPSGQGGSDERLAERNSQTLRSLGCRVVRVPTQAHNLHGGIHCLVNVLE